MIGPGVFVVVAVPPSGNDVPREMSRSEGSSVDPIIAVTSGVVREGDLCCHHYGINEEVSDGWCSCRFVAWLECYNIMINHYLSYDRYTCSAIMC